MSLRVTVSLIESDYTGFDDTTPVTIELTERQAAICLSLVILANGRGIWNAMDDSNWDNLQSYVADIIEQLEIP